MYDCLFASTVCTKMILVVLPSCLYVLIVEITELSILYFKLPVCLAALEYYIVYAANRCEILILFLLDQYHLLILSAATTTSNIITSCIVLLPSF